MNHTQEPQQKFYAVIETRMMDDQRLGDGEIILYARIASMTLKHGYFDKSNNYLSKLLRICIRQVTYRLKKLRDCGYIHIETQKKGMLWDRKIFLKHEPKPRIEYEKNALKKICIKYIKEMK